MNSTLKICIAIFVSLPISLFAQLNGSYTIGGSSPDYATISAAVSALSSSGVNGPTTFNIATGTYTENITIPSISGVSSTNRVTFQSATGDSTDVIITSLSTTSQTNNFTILLNGCLYINLKHLTIQRTGTDTYSRVIDMQSSVSRVNISNCIIKNDLTASTSGFASLIHSQNTNANKPSHIYIHQNKFLNGSYAISMQGITQANASNNIEITENILTGQYRSGVYLAYQDAPVISDNIITSSSAYYSYRAIDIFYANDELEIISNDIEINKSCGIYISNTFGSNVTYGLIQNNFVSVAGSSSFGLIIQNSGYINVYFNSFNLYGNSSRVFEIDGASTVSLRVMNNIFANQNGSYTIYVKASVNNAFTYCNNNDLYSSSTSQFAFYKNNGNVGSLQAWKSASSQGANSISVNPGFNSNTDLKIIYSPVSEAGSFLMNLPYQTNDYYLYSRNSSTPDIGAHEFSRPNLKVRNHGIPTSYCKGEKRSLKITITNLGNTVFKSNLNASYVLGTNSPINASIPMNNLATGDSIIYTFGTKINFNTVGTYDLRTNVKLNSDVDTTNNKDTLYQMTVNDVPSVDLGMNYYQCAHDTTMLNAGTGFDTYQWNTGASTQWLVADTSNFGLGGRYFKVTVGLNNCFAKDSILIFFQDCTGIDEEEDQLNAEIYPNPATDILNIEVEQKTTVRIFNSQSQMLEERIIRKGTTPLNVDNYKPGIYFIQLYSEGLFTTRKLQIK